MKKSRENNQQNKQNKKQKAKQSKPKSKSLTMSRPFDIYLPQYRSSHSAGGQVTRHLLANDLLEHYGASRSNYREAMSQTGGVNYRMGNSSTNSRDRWVDNGIVGSVFGVGREYDADKLASRGLSYHQQGNYLGTRFDTAKRMYESTGEHKYYMMQKDIRQVAKDNLNIDGREWRLSSK